MTGLKKMCSFNIKSHMALESETMPITNLKDRLLQHHATVSNNSLISTDRQRQEAFILFKEKGFPSTKEETWRFTSLESTISPIYDLVDKAVKDLTIDDIQTGLTPNLEAHLAVFVNGLFAPHLSDLNEANFVAIPLSKGEQTHGALIEKHYGNILKQDAQERLTALNTLLAKEGLFVHIPKNTHASKPLELLFVYTDGLSENIYQPRNLFIIDKQAQIQIIEKHIVLDGSMPCWINTVNEAFVDRNAHFKYFKIQNNNNAVTLSDATYIKQERDSIASSFTFSLGGKWIRNGLFFYHQDELVETHLKGITFIDDEQFTDHHTLVEHAQPNCQSRQVYKGIFSGNAHGVFNGQIKVAVDAQKINAFQQNNNLLLSEKARINTKPQLEILADDVRCSHGCTIGQLNGEALFYLQSRGIPEKEARALLTFAFCTDILEEIKLSPLKMQIESWIAEKLNVDI